MAGFSDTLRLTVDVIAGQTQSFKGFLSGLKSDIGEAEGAFGKFKAAGSGAMSFISNNAAGLAAGAGAAVAAFAVSSITDFQKVVLEVGNFRDALGLSAEEASRWVEVAGDLGIGADKIEKSFGLMLRTAGNSPQVFADLGVEIARTKDGAVDANGTFLNVIERLHGMRDPAEQAATAQKLLGRAWMDSAELIELGAEGVKARLADVSDAQVFTDEQISQGYEFRDALDELSDTVTQVKNKLAEALIPVLTDVAGVVKPAIEGFQKLYGVLQTLESIPIAGWFITNMVEPLKAVKNGFDLLPTDDFWHDLFFGENADDVKSSLAELSGELNQTVLDAYGIEVQAKHTGSAVEQLSSSFAGLTPTVEQAAEREKDAAEAAKELADKQAELDAAMDEVNASLQEQIDRLTAMHDQAINAADATLAVNEAQGSFIEAVTTSNQLLKDGKDNTEDFANSVLAERDAMIDVAKATEASGRKHAEAQGQTYSAKQAVDDFNGSLLNNATYATPAARDAIANYIAEANGIDPTKATEITAAIRAGDIPEAKRLLDGASETRSASIFASALNTAAVNSELNNVANPGGAPRQARIVLSGPGANRAIGGTPAPGEMTTVGEHGPEVVDWRLGRPKVIPRAESANITDRQGGPAMVNNFYMQDGDPVKIAAAVDRVMWFRNAGPRRSRA